MTWAYLSALAVGNGGKKGDDEIVKSRSFKATFRDLDTRDPARDKYLEIEEQNCKTGPLPRATYFS